MKKIAFLLILGVLFLGNTSHLHAQILNGSFTDGFTDWTTVGGSSGGPQVLTTFSTLPTGVTPPTPPTGSTQALVQSENGDTGAMTALAATIDSALGVTLPSTDGTGTAYPGNHLPVNGQAIYQTFTLGAEATLSFAYSFQTYDSIPFDRTGYVLDGVYHQLASPTLTYLETPDPTPTAYAPVSLVLSPGSHTLGFVAYNTGDNTLSSSLYVTDVTVPEPSEWMLIVLGCAGLVIVRKLRSKLSAI